MCFTFMKLYILFFILTIYLVSSHRTFLLSGAGSILSAFLSYQWYFHQHCVYSWSSFNSTEFHSFIGNHLYGQHLAKSTVVASLKAHVMKTDPQKALVLSFHGWTGSGKNHMSKLISTYLYGNHPEYVHWYIATHDFPHPSEIKTYKNKLLQEIPEHTKKCGQSLFIFDEMDKMPPGIIDVIKPFIDFYDDVGGTDYRKNIFIFLSNAGGKEITRVAFNFWLDGKDREDINMRDIEPLINQGAFNEIGGLQHSDIVKNNLIDVYVPFLPLEKHHIKQCIEHEVRLQGKSSTQDIIERISNEIIYYPPQFELFSVSGCKKISHKVDLYINDIDDGID